MRPARGSSIELRIANALFAQKGHTFLPAYLDTLAGDYGAGVSLLDFKASPDPSRVAINDWVEDITEGHIKDLLRPGQITKDKARKVPAGMR